MLATIKHSKKAYTIDLSKPLDISIAIHGDDTGVNAWYIGEPKITPHKEGEFIGKVAAGASTNFNDIWFNPHAHGTHTECVGHISKEFHSVNQNRNRFFFLAEVVTIAPEKLHNDFIISKNLLAYALKDKNIEAVVIRTLPNTRQKLSRHYSNTNPPYLTEAAAQFLVDRHVEHLLIDLPSVDKEKDGGQLLAHKAFWNFEGKVREQATITEFIYVENDIRDGTYFLDLQIAPFENDASPSRPLLYKIKEL
jgi:kynurenine formamidase